MATLRERLAELLTRYSDQLEAAFLEAVADLRNGIQIRMLVEALDRQDIDAAIQALNLEPAAYSQFRLVMRDTLAAAGSLQSTFIPQPPGARVLFRFDVADPAAEAVIRRVTGDRITNIVEQDKLAARAAILAGFELGQGPNRIALDIAGRMGPGHNQRQGGIVGLSVPFQGHVDAMRARLASGEPDEMVKVFAMTRRDKRFDATIQKAINAGKPVAQADLDRIVGRYSDRLLALRGENIGRTETGMAVMQGRMESFRQGLGKTGYTEAAVTRKWRHGGGGLEPRILHVQMNNVTVRGLDQPFILPDGTMMMHPLDPAGGAEHVVNCTCDMQLNIDYSYGLT